MNPVPRLALALAAFVMSSCATAFERRIERYPEAWAQLPEEHKALAAQARVAEGMGRDAVFFSWGPPHRVSEGADRGRRFERWDYFAYTPVYSYRSGFGFGYGYGGYGYRGYCPAGYGFYDFGPDIFYVPREAANVDFEGGRVVAYTRER
jgi:hypothetical protein